MRTGGVDEKGPERLVALSDGIFAIAMTLLVLDIRVASGLHADAFREALSGMLPALGAYALSFTILAGFWRDHRRILNLVRQVDGLTLRLALAGLGAIALVPFPTTLLSDYASKPPAVACYAATVVVIDLLELALFLTVWFRPWMAHPISRHVAQNIVLDLGSTILVFAATVPVAFFFPKAAIWTWLVLAPVKLALGRRQRSQADGPDRARRDRRDTARENRPDA
ncbi:TMEM175 family protein [Streptomyces sp. NBC_00388]|uniref:TMEM175 family protein n=1 Tax=Streptomyces sp. NBC_00388 TaxID=2975735 RepID=UPI002E1A6EB2